MVRLENGKLEKSQNLLPISTSNTVTIASCTFEEYHNMINDSNYIHYTSYTSFIHHYFNVSNALTI